MQVYSIRYRAHSTITGELDWDIGSQQLLYDWEQRLCMMLSLIHETGLAQHVQWEAWDMNIVHIAADRNELRFVA
jgi:hypothetical protein